jgi:hypothetical protein
VSLTDSGIQKDNRVKERLIIRQQLFAAQKRVKCDVRAAFGGVFLRERAFEKGRKKVTPELKRHFH